MERVLLLDADSTIPNLALCRLSSYHKKKADRVSLVRLGLAYFPNRVNKQVTINTKEYDKVFCSVVFEGTKKFIEADGAVFGGTGTDDISRKLPDEVELCRPDLSLYPDNKVAYGFITRGCIRNCYFCKVPAKEGNIRQVDDPEAIGEGFETIKFMDNNFLAFDKHMEMLERISKMGKKVSFNQGLDIRLLTQDNSLALSRLRYDKEYIFAFDDIRYMEMMNKGMSLLRWRKPWQIKVFVYCHPDHAISSVIQRVLWCRRNEVLPYIMRDISCYREGPLTTFFYDIAAYCNQPNFFKKMSFEQFLVVRNSRARVPNDVRILANKDIWNKGAIGG